MTVVKICGITTVEDALMAAEAGADMLGLNFYPSSPRSLSVEAAINLAANLRNRIELKVPLLVGLFVNETTKRIQEIMDTVGLDAAQLSGNEPAGDVAALMGRAVKAIRPQNPEDAITQAEQMLVHMPFDIRLPSLIVDAYHPQLFGGTGEVTSVELARAVNARVPRLMLAGGLNPGNVAERITAIKPWGVDVASGVEGEIKGRKDPGKVRAFIAAVRGVEATP